jgi:hypothetical protein
MVTAGDHGGRARATVRRCASNSNVPADLEYGDIASYKWAADVLLTLSAGSNELVGVAKMVSEPNLRSFCSSRYNAGSFGPPFGYVRSMYTVVSVSC